MDIKYAYYISSKGFKISEGTAAQFLKADGSVDNNSYVTTNTPQNIIAQKTFTQSPIIPDGTAGNHAVNVNQLANYITTNTNQVSITGSKTLQGDWTFNGKATFNGNYHEAYTIKSSWLAVNTGLNSANKVAYLNIEGFIESTNRQLVIEVESIAGNGQYKKLKKVFNINFNATNDLLINGSKYTEIVGRDVDVRYGIGEVEKVSNTSLRIPLIWLSSNSLNINQITVKSAAGGVLKTLTFSVVYDATSALTTEVPLNNLVGTQILGIDTTLSGGVAITGGNTVYLRTLQPSARQDSLVRALRNEFTPYVASSTSTNYPTTLGTGIRSERYSSATDQRGFDIFSGGVAGQIYFKTFSAANADSNWEMFASREWTTLQLASYVTQSALNAQLAGYATLNGVQTFSNTITFSQSPIVPDPTLINHAVSYGFMANAIEESQNDIASYVSGAYQTLSTPQIVSASKSLTNNFPFKFKVTDTKSWTIHKPNGNSLIFAPSTTINNEDWDWTNQIAFYEDSTIEARKFRVPGGSNNQFLKGDGSLDSTPYLTTNTAQSVFGYKTFEAGSELLLKGDDENLIQSLKTGNVLGGNIVAGWYYRHYDAIWKAGCIRNSASSSEGFGFELSTDSGTTFNKIFKIQSDGNLVTNNFGLASEWKQAYDWGNHANEGYIKPDGNGAISAKGFINPDFNSPDYVLTGDGGAAPKSEFGGTTVKYVEVLPGNSFTPTPDGTHFNVFALSHMKVYLENSSGSENGQVVNTFNNTSGSTEIWRDGAIRATITGNKTNKFIKTSLGWMRDDGTGTTSFI